MNFKTTPELASYLSTRRTIPAVNLMEPAPSDAVLNDILTIAARVPDHGKLAPWRFIVYPQSEARRIGEVLAEFWRSENPDAPDERLELENRRFSRAPLVVGVVSAVKQSAKIPQWEQHLSAGAVCMNLLHAVRAHGFSAQWLTEWFTYHQAAAHFLGAGEGEQFAGFMHIGTPSTQAVERSRPDIADIRSDWKLVL